MRSPSQAAPTHPRVRLLKTNTNPLWFGAMHGPHTAWGGNMVHGCTSNRRVKPPGGPPA